MMIISIYPGRMYNYTRQIKQNDVVDELHLQISFSNYSNNDNLAFSLLLDFSNH